MTKITNELLEDYAMLYPRIRLIKLRYRKDLLTPIENIKRIGEEIEYIQLRSIESITDEELMYISDLLGCVEVVINEWLKKYIKTKSTMFSNVTDYLRSIGIATPFRGITVDELVELGKLKLI